MISQKLCPAFFLEYLAINTDPVTSIFVTYIVFLTRLKKIGVSRAKKQEKRRLRALVARRGYVPIALGCPNERSNPATRSSAPTTGAIHGGVAGVLSPT